MMTDIHGWMTTTQAAQVYGIDLPDLYALIRSNRVRWVNKGSTKKPFYFVWEEDLQRHIAGAQTSPRNDASTDAPESLAHALAEYTQVEQRIFQISAQLAPEAQKYRMRVKGDEYDEWKRRAQSVLSHAMSRKAVLEAWMADHQRDYPQCVWELHRIVIDTQMQLIAAQAQLIELMQEDA